MTRILILATVLACCACSTSGPGSPTGPGMAPPPAAAANAEVVDPNMTIEARMVLEKIPTGPTTPAASLKKRYPDKAALLGDLRSIRPTYAVELDGRNIWTGVGPAISFRTNPDSSVSH